MKNTVNHGILRAIALCAALLFLLPACSTSPPVSFGMRPVGRSLPAETMRNPAGAGKDSDVSHGKVFLGSALATVPSYAIGLSLALVAAYEDKPAFFFAAPIAPIFGVAAGAKLAGADWSRAVGGSAIGTLIGTLTFALGAGIVGLVVHPLIVSLHATVSDAEKSARTVTPPLVEWRNCQPETPTLPATIGIAPVLGKNDIRRLTGIGPYPFAPGCSVLPPRFTRQATGMKPANEE